MMSCLWKPLISWLTTLVHLFKHISTKYNTDHGNVQPSCSSPRRRVPCPRDELAFGSKDFNWRVLAQEPKSKAGKSVSLSSLKWVLYRSWKAALPGRSHYSQKEAHKRQITVCKRTQGQWPSFFGCVLWSDNTKVELFGRNGHCYIWTKKGWACKPENIMPAVIHEGCGVVFAAGGTDAFHKRDGIMRKEILKQHLKKSARK